MTDNQQPERVAGDDADRIRQRLDFADNAEALLMRLLKALGYVSDINPTDLLAAVGAWLALLGVMLRDPGGQIAGLWWRAYDGALGRCPFPHDESRRRWSEEEADYAVQSFCRRFPPMIEDAPRDTIDDLDALRAALEDADAKASKLEEIANAAEAQAERAERELAELRASAIVPLPKPERASAGQRWALLVDVSYTHYSSVKSTHGAAYTQMAMRRSDAWIYLGNAPTSEG